MVTSGPLLPLPGPGWTNVRYICATCRSQGLHVVEDIPYGPGDVPPRHLRLICSAGGPGLVPGLTHRAMHLYVLEVIEYPPEEE